MAQWWQIVVTVICIILSGTFSGLTLGLMSLDIIDLRVLTESGTDREKWYARRILPIRKHGNWLLCTLLIGNTAVNSALAIVTADLFGGVAGFVASTFTILYIGEIIPQAVCHRFGLVIGAHAVPFIRLTMFISAPLSFTTAKALDFFLGGESATRYNKSQLKSLLSIHGTGEHDLASSNSNHRSEHHPTEPVDSRTYVAAVENTTEQVAVVELQQISIHPEHDPTHDKRSASQPIRNSMRTPTAPERFANRALNSEETATSPRQDSRPKTSRIRTWNQSRLYDATFARIVTRNRDKKDRERDSESSNPPLTKDEITMLGGAFDFSQKTVGQVMTTLDDVFMLEASLSLNFEVMLLIFQSGHSRIPVYDKSRDNIIGVLFTKDLILLDPEDSVPIKTVLLFFGRTVLLVFFDTTLNKMLNIFRQGGGHMAIVQKKKGGADENPETLGIVTLEDLIEEIIGQDIVDETDVYTDNVSKQRVKRVRSIHPEVLKMFDSKHDEELLTEKEVLVVSSYLSNNTEEFAQSCIDTDILRQVLAEIPIVKYPAEDSPMSGSNPIGHTGLATMASALAGELKADKSGDAFPNVSAPDITSRLEASTRAAVIERGQAVPDVTIYTRGVPTKNAYLIINGRLEICAGNDGFISEAGPWTLLGVRALTEDIYAPDFTARVIERPARLLRVSRKLYRVMKQYTAKGANWTARETGSIKDRALLPLRPSVSPPKRRGTTVPNENPPSSLALAAAAAAVAVGAPKADEGGPSLSGTASEATVVRKARSRPNGQSIEWSEMEPRLFKKRQSSPGNRKAQSSPDITIDALDDEGHNLNSDREPLSHGSKEHPRNEQLSNLDDDE
ncbi:Metal transporter CNNM2 [Gracilariopsis chorda]|uniref:Metal transporter CNNM2 n=1 Tax=Gracilariopsis chorda TaxID=448386 RepID=A0A2V3IPT9_9FLOR|nr:Metal transporter CNNM2 [Gracilariopsis chorda]|eukprot:PXF44084.1 Metal transporter CNNM2 [Gracilariopsis chorda]